MRKRVLVCPMDWGLGHASRDAAIIHQLLTEGFDVIIGADGAPLAFLRELFPSLSYIIVPSGSIKYPEKGKNMFWKMLLSVPKLLKNIRNEHQLLKLILKVNTVDIVISDNRYGLWNKSVYSVFITHQLRIKAPPWLKWAEMPMLRMNRWFIKHYDECWIPDFEGKINLSGSLSHLKELPENCRFIGPLSRFNPNLSVGKLPELLNEDFRLLVILSGPEPQRSIFERMILNQLAGFNEKCLLVQGKPLSNSISQSAKITIVNHLKSEYLMPLISKVPLVISRSGYSSIMDFTAICKNAILVPTPGQTEQEYLAKYMFECKWFYTTNQQDFNLQKSIHEFETFTFNPLPQYVCNQNSLLRKLI